MTRSGSETDGDGRTQGSSCDERTAAAATAGRPTAAGRQQEKAKKIGQQQPKSDPRGQKKKSFSFRDIARQLAILPKHSELLVRIATFVLS